MVPDFLTDRDGWMLLAVFMYGVSSNQCCLMDSSGLGRPIKQLYTPSCHNEPMAVYLVNAQTTPMFVFVFVYMYMAFKPTCVRFCKHQLIWQLDLGNRFGHTQLANLAENKWSWVCWLQSTKDNHKHKQLPCLQTWFKPKRPLRLNECRKIKPSGPS